MDLKDIIKQILSSRQDLTLDDVLKRIKEKKESSGGYLTDRVAARIVASELGINISYETPCSLQLSINDLVSGLNDVTIMGRVLQVYPPQSFKRMNGTEGKFARLIVTDKTGSLKVVLWDDKAELVKTRNIREGYIVRVSHGYLREGRDGKLELHVGARGDIHILPQDVSEREKDLLYPTRGSFTKIGRLKDNMRSVNVLGRIVKVEKPRLFKRSTGRKGKVSSVVLEDDTGRVRLTLWDEKTALSEQAVLGDIVLIENAYTHKQPGNVELNLGKHGKFILNPKIAAAKRLPPSKKENVKKITELEEGLGPVNVKGTVVTTPLVREVITSKGEKVTVTTFELSDETGRIRVSLWRQLAQQAKTLMVGDNVYIKNAYVKKGFADQLEITSRSSTSFNVLPKQN